MCKGRSSLWKCAPSWGWRHLHSRNVWNSAGSRKCLKSGCLGLRHAFAGMARTSPKLREQAPLPRSELLQSLGAGPANSPMRGRIGGRWRNRHRRSPNIRWRRNCRNAGAGGAEWPEFLRTRLHPLRASPVRFWDTEPMIGPGRRRWPRGGDHNGGAESVGGMTKCEEGVIVPLGNFCSLFVLFGALRLADG